MPTAQDVYATMLRTELAPRLRELGFKGSGNVFTLPSDTHWIGLGFQKSVWSSADEITFTANISVVSKDAWEQIRAERNWPARPAPNVGYGAVWWKRIGQLLPSHTDVWWSIHADVPESERVAALISSAVRDYVLPAVTQVVRSN